MFQGVFTALITPFTKDEKVDEKALRKLVDFQIDGGVDGLVPVGTTGESPTLSPEETEQVIGLVIEQTAGRVPVIAGTGSNCTDKAIHMTERAKKLRVSIGNPHWLLPLLPLGVLSFVFVNHCQY